MPQTVTDKRVERSKAAVLAETYRQLTLNGMSGVSIDDVSRESGVAKTTIYRHWPSRSALLIDACSRMGGAQAAPETGDLREDLIRLTRVVGEQLQSAAWSSVLPSIIDAAERDTDISQMWSALHEANTAPYRTAIEQAKARGELSSQADAAGLIAATLGPLFYRRWFSKETIDEPFVRSTVVGAICAAKADDSPTSQTPETSSAPIARKDGARGKAKKNLAASFGVKRVPKAH